MRTTIAIACLAAGFMASGAAFAQGRDEDARVQFQQGIELYKQGDFEQAAVAFSRAYELKPSYKILFNLAQAENELKHYAKALEAYVRYLAEGGGDVPQERVAEVKAETKRLNALVGMVTVKGGPSGAVVLVDDERKGETPLPGPVFVDLGARLVVVRKGGVEVFREKIQVAGGKKVEVVVDGGEARPAAAAPEPRPEPASPPGNSPAGRGDQPPENEQGGEVSSGGRVWTWVAVGVAGAAAVGAGVTGGLALSTASDVESRCDGDTCPASSEKDARRAESLALASDVLVGVAAAGAVAAVALWFLEPGEGAAATVGIGPNGLAVQGRF